MNVINHMISLIVVSTCSSCMALTSGNPMEISRHVQVPFDPAMAFPLGTSWVAEPADGHMKSLHSEFSFGSSSQFLPEKCSLCVLLVQVPVLFLGGQCSELFVLYLIYSYICVIKHLVGNQTWQSIQHHCLTEKKTRVSPCESFTINIIVQYMHVCICMSYYVSLFLSLSLTITDIKVYDCHPHA